MSKSPLRRRLGLGDLGKPLGEWRNADPPLGASGRGKAVVRQLWLVRQGVSCASGGVRTNARSGRARRRTRKIDIIELGIGACTRSSSLTASVVAEDADNGAYINFLSPIHSIWLGHLGCAFPTISGIDSDSGSP